jgi:hypothetical protein
MKRPPEQILIISYFVPFNGRTENTSRDVAERVQEKLKEKHFPTRVELKEIDLKFGDPKKKIESTKD